MSKEPQPKKRFEVKFRMHAGFMEKDIFIDGERLDYSVNVSDYLEAQKMGLQFKRAVQEDIAKHFIACVSEVVGRHITVEEIQEAIKTGWI